MRPVAKLPALFVELAAAAAVVELLEIEVSFGRASRPAFAEQPVRNLKEEVESEAVMAVLGVAPTEVEESRQHVEVVLAMSE